MPLRSIEPLPQRARRALFCTLAFIIALLLPDRLPAVDSIDLDARDIYAADWSAKGVTVRLTLGADGKSGARISVARALFIEPLGEFRNILVVCPATITLGAVIGCRNARVTATHSRLGKLAFTATATLDRRDQALSVKVRGLRVAGGQWQLDANWRQQGWQLAATADRIGIAALRKFAAPWITLPADIEADGALSPHVVIAGRDKLDRINLVATLDSLTLNNADGTLATDKLKANVDAQLIATAHGFEIKSHLAFTAGQAYRDPVFVDLARVPASIEWTGDWDSAAKRLNVSRFAVDQPGVLAATGTASLALAAAPLVSALHVRLEQGLFPGLYATYLQPFLVNGDLKDLATKGSLTGSAEILDGSPTSLDLHLTAVDADDTAGHMAVHGLGGNVSWRNDPASQQPSHVEWQDGQAYGFSGGKAAIDFALGGRNFRMLKPTRLPVFDGGVAVAAFELGDIGLPEMSVLFDATIEPISMRRICQALGWPEFSGTLAGRVPRLTFKNKILSFDGDLDARVFDGRVTVSKLRLEDPLGVWPRLSGEIEVDNLDLQAVTGTFSFGEITGRLSGYVHGLELFAWQPTAFDAVLATPPNDRSEHRISQRAISNISAIGGGGSTRALSSGVLKFFENFRYERLGLACKLADEVCLMRGIGPARNGYYIVRGRGLPRIDVVGNAGRIIWPQLVANLKAATKAGAPEVRTSP
jgi:hypothetical protein